MAIDWSAQYPGQIGVDPAWPYGKPRNIVVPGDGTGTPLEAAWVSDLAGWQAALLTEAGITPSGNPDSVGASDYTEAIKALASANMSGFTSMEHTWTAAQKFTAGYIANHWGVSGEVLYCNPGTGATESRARTIMLPLSSFMSSHDVGSDKLAWRSFLSDDGSQVYWDTSVASKSLLCLYHVPHQAVITSVRAGVHAGGIIPPNTLQMTVGLVSDREGDVGFEQLSATTWGAPVTVTDYDGVVTAYPPANVIDGARHSLAVRFTATTTGGQFRVYWAKAVFNDPGPRNF